MASKFATQALFNKLVKEHNLVGWKLLISDGLTAGQKKQSAMGHCHYTTKTVWVSETIMTYASWDTVKDIVLHEIAHALTPGANHGRLWQLMATKLGANPKATNRLNPLASDMLRKEPRFRKPRVKRVKPVMRWTPDIVVDAYSAWKQDFFALRNYHSRTHILAVQGYDIHERYDQGFTPQECFDALYERKGKKGRSSY